MVGVICGGSDGDSTVVAAVEEAWEGCASRALGLADHWQLDKFRTLASSVAAEAGPEAWRPNVPALGIRPLHCHLLLRGGQGFRHKP